MSFNPITARFYEGSLTSQINVDINTGQPNITAAARINGMHTKDLWRDLNGGHPKISIETMGDMSFQVKTVGMNSSMLIRHMNGSGSIDFKQGVISGIDLKAVIESAYALIKKQPSNRSGNSDQSRFDSVSGNIAIRNGILQSENLTLDSPDFSTLGNGRVDLPSQWINYIFHTRVKKAVSGRNNDWTNLYGIAIPIAVRGKLNDPAISLDAGQLLKAIAEKQLNAAGDDAKAQLKNKILEQVPGQAGELLNSLTR